MPIQEETPGQTISRLAWENLGVPQEMLVEVAGERNTWISLLKLLLPQPDKQQKMKRNIRIYTIMLHGKTALQHSPNQLKKSGM